MSSFDRFRSLLVVVAAVMMLAACASPALPPVSSATEWLSVSSPLAGQELAGTVMVAASGVGGRASGVAFRLGSLLVEASDDGTATIDTRVLAEGTHLFEATASVNGRVVSERFDVVVRNDLPTSASVGGLGGALKSGAGSFVLIPPGALGASTMVTVRDTTQEEIKDEFGVDYPALGVTFLGALEVDTNGGMADLPVSVDLAGWTEAVQPGHQVVMFALAADAGGDGVGELMFAADAQATVDGSVVTRPVPRSEVYGFGSAATASVRRAASAKPGEIVRMTGRGFNPVAPLSNAARYGPSAAPVAETLISVVIAEAVGFNALMEIEFAVPMLGAAGERVALHNLTTGYRTEPIALTVGPAGSAPASTWSAFVAQVAVAVGALTVERADLAADAVGWLGLLDGHASGLAAAMVHNAGVVSAANAASLDALGSGALSAGQRSLVVHHALLLDAVGVSIPDVAGPAADLATLLVAMLPAAGVSMVGADATTLQAGGAPCAGGGATATITFGAPVVTGMGSAPPGACASGNGSGGNGPSGMSLGVGALSVERLATTSLRAGSLRPIPGAYVVVHRRGTNTRLTPFTAIADRTGFFKIPFIPSGEPFTIRASDPRTGNVASYDGVAAGPGVTTPVQLVFGASSGGPDAPTASFSITPVPNAGFDGSVEYFFDAGDSVAADGSIRNYIWDFDGLVKSMGRTATFQRRFGRNGSYTIRLSVVDEEARTGVATQQLVIDDLPYDYWGVPPVRVDLLPGGGNHGSRSDSSGQAISADGRYVAFTIGRSGGGDLLPEDTNGLADVYRKDLTTGELRLVSEGAPGVEVASYGSWYAAPLSMSGDGRYVAYSSTETVDGARRRVHLRDLDTGALTTIAADGTDFGLTSMAVSDDGNRLLYAVQFVEDNSTTGAWLRDVAEGTDVRLVVFAGKLLWVHPIALTPDGRLALVGTSGDGVVQYGSLYVIDLDTMEHTLVSTNADGQAADAGVAAGGRAISSDGRYVAFSSRATNLVAEAPEPFRTHVYLKDTVDGTVVRISENARGEAIDRASDIGAVGVSGDGRYVSFTSAAWNLVPLVQDPGACDLGDCGGHLLYVKERVSGRVAMASVALDHRFPIHPRSAGLFSENGRYLVYGSSAKHLVRDGDDGRTKVFRSDNPLWVP